MNLIPSRWFLRSAAAAIVAGGCGLALTWAAGPGAPEGGRSVPPATMEFDWLTQGPGAPTQPLVAPPQAGSEGWVPKPPQRNNQTNWPIAQQSQPPRQDSSIKWPANQPQPSPPTLAGTAQVLRLPPVAAAVEPPSTPGPRLGPATPNTQPERTVDTKRVPWSGPVGTELEVEEADDSAASTQKKTDGPGSPSYGNVVSDPRDQEVLRLAKTHIANAAEMADRRAYYSARSEFLQALSLIARAYDARQNDTRHMAALRAAVAALEESADFVGQNGLGQAPLTVEALVAGHRTPVYRHGAENVTHVEALRAYYTFAQEQFGLALDRSPQGSSALHGLGKLYVAISQEPSPRIADAATQALVFQQAALTVDENNWQAANELAVLLAKGGRLEEAQSWLAHSVRVSPRAENWHNLAVVRQRLGQVWLAEEARRQAQDLARRQPSSILRGGAPRVDLVSPATFVGGSETASEHENR